MVFRYGYHCCCIGLLTLALSACGGGGGSSDNLAGGGGISPDYDTLQAAEVSSPYADVLADCTVINSAFDACTFDTLPLLSPFGAPVSIDDVMNRTIVSHPWMATRFREVLERMPAQVLALIEPVTAIVIAADIRPSYYSGWTAALYIDPADLWLSNAEKASISTNPDYRAEFGDSLAFVSLARYVEGSQYAWTGYSLLGNETRTLADIERPMAALLFHELAHANDALPRVVRPFIDMRLTAYEAVVDNFDSYISDQLTASAPLNSALMSELGAVMYGGLDPTEFQREISAQSVGLEFESDGASDDYAYSTIREDLAMLVEEVLMNYHYGIDREVAYTNMPSGDDRFYCDSYLVAWGQRSRIIDPLVLSRAETGLQLLLDQADVSAYLQDLPDLQNIPINSDWCDVNTFGNAPPALQVLGDPERGDESVQRQALPESDLRRQHRVTY